MQSTTFLQEKLKSAGHNWSLSTKAPVEVGAKKVEVCGSEFLSYGEATIAEYTVYSLLADAQRRNQTSYEQALLKVVEKIKRTVPVSSLEGFTPEAASADAGEAYTYSTDETAAALATGNRDAIAHVWSTYPQIMFDLPPIFEAMKDEVAEASAYTQALSDACLCYFLNVRSVADDFKLDIDDIPNLRPSTLNAYMEFYQSELNPPKDEADEPKAKKQ
jgi:hypothetical protein